MSNLFRSLSHARMYALFRPVPPNSLIESIVDYLGQKVPNDQWLRAADVGCGSGQSTKPLAKYFKEVKGFDTSESQLKEATDSSTHLNNVCYEISSAELLPLGSNSVQLLTASQSVHWFDLPKFFAEVNRVLNPNGVLALYGYKMPYISHHNYANDERLLKLVNDFYKSPLLMWSKKERQLVDEGLASINLPFNDCVRKDSFVSDISATAEDLKGYLQSWSGFNVLKNTDQQKADQFLNNFDQQIRSIFGDKNNDEIELKVHYNFFLLMARKS